MPAPPTKAPSNEVKPLKANPSEVKPLDPNLDLKRKWHSMTPKQQQSAVITMSPEDVDKLYTALGVWGHATDFTAAPPVGSKQWMKDKALGLVNWGQENLSNLAGPVGAHFGAGIGAGIGENIDPAGGAAIGAPIGEIVGAGVAGGGAEAVRQGLEHLEGVDKYNEPWENTWQERGGRILDAGRDQMVAQAVGFSLGHALRPTLERSIKNLYAAGMLDYGDPLAKEATVGTGKSAYTSAGTLEKVVNDVMEAEKAGAKAGKPAVTIRDFYNNIEALKNDIGKQVDAKMALPIQQGGKLVPLREATPNPMPLVDLINDFGKKDSTVFKASLASRDPSVIDAKKYLDMVKQKALTFQQPGWNYGRLADERIAINNELNEYYGLTKDGKRLFLEKHPLFEVDKAIADYIRKVTYPEMDRLSGQAEGTTAELQGKRGALMSIQDQLVKQMGDLATESRQGAAKGMNVSSYATPSGIGWSLHRLPLKIGMNDVEREANTKVSRAFGHTLESKARKLTASPRGSEVWGDNILSFPVRYLIHKRDEGYLSTRPTPKAPADQDDDGPQSSVTPPASPRELMERAKQLNPAALGQTAFNHIAVNPTTGHRIASRDGVDWVDAVTGQPVAKVA